MSNVEKLVKFIKENKLNFNEKESGLNSACTIIGGYALYIDRESIDVTDVWNAIKIIFPDFTDADELERVFNFCEYRKYEKWWEKEENRKLYKL